MSKKNIIFKKFFIFTLINFYEFIFGFLIGYLFNKLTNYIIPFSTFESIYLTVIINIVLVSVCVTFLLLSREIILGFPGVNGCKENKWFYHPPPLALAFGFWFSQEQMILRNKNMHLFIEKIING